MKLVFYSGGQERKNTALHDAMSQLAGRGRQKSMTYVPFCHEGSEVFFNRAKRRYSRFGFTKFRCLSVDRPFLQKDLSAALRSNVIYLAGGNTFYFLKHLRKSGLLERLRNYAKRGGVIAGLSAGGIVLTPHIGLAGYPPFDADKNDVGLTNFRGLGLVGFEFFPHYRNTKKLNVALQKYSKHSEFPIFASKDGGGLVINGNRNTFFGDVTVFSGGRIIHFIS